MNTVRIVLVSTLGALLCAGVALSQQNDSRSAAENSPRTERVYRLTIEVTDGRYQLVDAQPVEMVLPLTVKERMLDTDERATGYAFEILDGQRGRLLAGTLDDPTRLVAEWRDPEDPDRLQREVVRQEQTTFTLLVPAPAEAAYLRLTAPTGGDTDRDTADAEAEAAPRRELGLFGLP